MKTNIVLLFCSFFFLTACSDEKIESNPLAGYWKIESESLGSVGELSEEVESNKENQDRPQDYIQITESGDVLSPTDNRPIWKIDSSGTQKFDAKNWIQFRKINGTKLSFSYYSNGRKTNWQVAYVKSNAQKFKSMALLHKKNVARTYGQLNKIKGRKLILTHKIDIDFSGNVETIPADQIPDYEEDNQGVKSYNFKILQYLGGNKLKLNNTINVPIDTHYQESGRMDLQIPYAFYDNYYFAKNFSQLIIEPENKKVILIGDELEYFSEWHFRIK